MAGTILPKVVGFADLEKLIASRGGLASQQTVKGTDSWGDSSGEKYILQFRDGTSMTVTYDQANARAVVDDWGTVADALDQTAKKALSPAEQEAQDLELESRRLSNEKARRDLAQNPTGGQTVGAIKDYEDAVNYVDQQIRSGKMTYSDGQRYIKAMQAKLENDAYGATPYQRTQADRAYQTDRAGIGAGMLNQRVSSGSGVLSNLLGATSDAMQKMLPGTGFDPHSYNPFALAKSFVTDLGGGQANYDAASAMLQGATSPIDEASPGAWLGTPENPGDPGIPDQQLDAPEMPQFGEGYQWQYPDGGPSSGPLPNGTASTGGFSNPPRWVYPDNGRTFGQGGY